MHIQSEKIAELLKLPRYNLDKKLFPQLRIDASKRRKAAIEEAINLKSGINQESKIYHEFYSFDDFKISFGKPGKEAAPDYKGKLGDNVNDMTPTLFFNGKPHQNKFSFDNIFELLYQISKI